ncbi:unnamed protein product [Urochloa decumbens]|uniref:Uncharacterized protein n=1 Tax=Urochloa decumbens TaxID=240449 RepID=A0ABC9ED30_9POAL
MPPNQPATAEPTQVPFPSSPIAAPNLLTKNSAAALLISNPKALAISAPQTLALPAAMAFLAPAAAGATSSLRTPIYVTASSGRRSVLPAAIKATASSGSATSPHPVLSSLRMAASAAVLLAATSPALACTPSAPPPTPLTVTIQTDDQVEKLIAAHPDGDDPIHDASHQSHEFESLIVETAALARSGAAEAARARLFAAAGGCDCESYAARLLAAQALFVDGKVDEAVAALEELAREEPADYRPLFCQSVLYLALGRVAESESMFQRCREVGGDALIVDPAMVVSAAGAEAVDAESGAEEVEAEPEPAEV